MKIKRLAALFLAGAVSASLLTGCGINKKAVVASYGDKNVTLGIANFMSRYEQAMYDDMYRSYSDDIWSQDMSGDGSTMQENLKESLMEEIHEMYTLKDHMDDYKVEITDEDKEAISSAVKAFMDANSKKALKEMGATTEVVEEVLTLYTIRSKMHDAIIAEADTEVSDEEANMRSYTMVKIDTAGYYDSSYNYVEYTEEEVAQKQDAAEKIAAAVADGKDIKKAAEDNGETATTGTYDADDTSLGEAVKEAMDALKEGETSKLITTDDAFVIARIDSDCDKEATEDNRKSIIEQRQEDHYTEVLEGWQKDDGWTVKEKQLAKIQFKNGFTQIADTEEDSQEESQEPEEEDDGTQADEAVETGTENE